MKLIDVHVHVVETLRGFARRGEFRAIGGGRARWANGEETMLIPPELGEVDVRAERLYAFLKKQGVERAVLLQGSFYGFQNEYSLESARRYPDLFVPACTADVYAQQSMEILERFVCGEGVRIIKFEVSEGGGMMGYHTPFALDGPLLARQIALAAGQGCTLVLDIGGPGMSSFQPEAVAEIAKSFPQMKIVVCHLLAPTLKDEEALKTALRALRLPNVWFDISAVPWNVYPEAYPYPTAARYVALARDAVGGEKLLWGSDLPSPMTRDSYEHLWDYLQASGLFSEKELAGIYRANAFCAYPL